MSNERVVLNKDQALSMLQDGDEIHTFRSQGSVLIGADWSRASILEAIEQNECEIGGETCQAMGHGLVIHANGPLFVECKQGFDYAAFETQVLAESSPRVGWSRCLNKYLNQ